MPSFDIVSNIDMHELTNAIDQATREINTRFDFKGSNACFEQVKEMIHLKAQNEFQIKQMQDILNAKLAKRNLDLKIVEYKEIQTSLSEAKQEAHLKEGIDTEFAKKITKFIKEAKLKVQASIQGEQVRVTGKKRDDLQEAIALLKKEDFKQPLQFTNFRD